MSSEEILQWSSYQRFELGQSMLAVDKLIVAVEGINISSWIAHHIDEDIQYDQVVELKKESKA